MRITYLLSIKYIFLFPKFILIKKSFGLIILLIWVIGQSACINSKKLTYFPEVKDTSFALVNKDFEPTIQVGDILFMGVTSLDPISSLLFNSSNAMPAQGASGGNTMVQNITNGLLVDTRGEIEVPKLGKIKVIGKTKAALEQLLQQNLLAYLKDPVVIIRFMNYRVTVLGEVARPSTVAIQNERISILEALGLCGDLTIYGNRSNILLIHENNGVKELHRINLNNTSLFSSPYYYLQSNDVLYVEPNKAKVYSSTAAPVILPNILASLSLILILITTLRK